MAEILTLLAIGLCVGLFVLFISMYGGNDENDDDNPPRPYGGGLLG